MVNFNIKKTNTTIQDLSKQSYQHNILDLQGCQKKELIVPGYLARLFINPNMFSLKFKQKVQEEIDSKSVDPLSKWWASRPINLNWNEICGENGIAVINKSCIESMEKQKLDNNLLFSLSSIQKSVQSGGDTLESTGIDHHINASSEKSTEVINSNDLYFIIGRFEQWSQRKQGSFPKLLKLTYECQNETELDNVMKPNNKEVLLNYVQHIAEQFKCEKIQCDFLKDMEKYGFDEKGIKSCSSLTKKFMDIPGVCPTPESKPKTESDLKLELKPEGKGKAIDLTSELERKEKLSIENDDSDIKPKKLIESTLAKEDDDKLVGIAREKVSTSNENDKPKEIISGKISPKKDESEPQTISKIEKPTIPLNKKKETIQPKLSTNPNNTTKKTKLRNKRRKKKSKKKSKK